MQPTLEAPAGAFGFDDASFAAYRPRLFGFFTKRGATREEAEDLTQTALGRVLQRDVRFPAEPARDAYVLRTAEHLWLDHRSRASRQRTESLDAQPDRDDDALARLPSALVTPPVALDDLLEAERRKALEDAIAELPAKMRQCLILKIYQERSHKEIAALLRIDLNTVKSHLGTAKKRLQERLGREWGKIAFDDEDSAP